MPFKPGDPRPQGAGNPRGGEIKRSREAREIAEKLGFCPFTILAHYAMRNHEALGLPEYQKKFVGKGDNIQEVEEYTISPELSQKSAKDAAKFILPELKSIEHKSDDSVDPLTRLIDAIRSKN
jgi:hypothetical protein